MEIQISQHCLFHFNAWVDLCLVLICLYSDSLACKEIHWSYRKKRRGYNMEWSSPWNEGPISIRVSCHMHSWSQDVSVKEQVGVKGLEVEISQFPVLGMPRGTSAALAPGIGNCCNVLEAWGPSAGQESFQLFSRWLWFGLCIRPSRKLRTFWGKVREGSRWD